MKKKIALITGITGQDGSYLAELLLSKNYEVHGIKRRTAVINTQNIDNLYEGPFKKNKKLHLHYGDLSDSSNLIDIIKNVSPDEIYNLAAQSHVSVSFQNPEYTANINALGTLRILEAIRILNLQNKTKFYQASSSEIYGNAIDNNQNENTKFMPTSPYAVSKLFSYWITVNYRNAYKIFACNGILFNHESKKRGETFVTRKVTRGIAKIILGIEDCLYIGNLNAKRDWGHAKDYVKMMWLMLQQKKPDDYVVATGKQYSVRQFIEKTCNYFGIKLKWIGKGKNEIGKVDKISKNLKYINKGQVIIKVSSNYFRKSEVNSLLGDSKKAKKALSFKYKFNLEKLINEMIEHDLKNEYISNKNKNIKVDDKLFQKFYKN